MSVLRREAEDEAGMRAEDVQEIHVRPGQDANGDEVQPPAAPLQASVGGGRAFVGEPAAAHDLRAQAPGEAQRQLPHAEVAPSPLLKGINITIISHPLIHKS